jgi:hypothetical protein
LRKGLRLLLWLDRESLHFVLWPWTEGGRRGSHSISRAQTGSGNVTFHIINLYKIGDYRQKENLTKQSFYVRIKVPIVFNFLHGLLF